ncbi:hypothetical protein BKA62DRAFT_364208 [Auriculariales sp. MPI-PUGE-AT-0066]|nr:hypothetical protein BKA62DRAFT_364208 [Auriculariales sp. MPI-PUGE-AT-0066]
MTQACTASGCEGVVGRLLAVVWQVRGWRCTYKRAHLPALSTSMNTMSLVRISEVKVAPMEAGFSSYILSILGVVVVSAALALAPWASIARTLPVAPVAKSIRRLELSAALSQLRLFCNTVPSWFGDKLDTADASPVQAVPTAELAIACARPAVAHARSPEFYFEDGNVLVILQNKEYKLYRGLIIRYSRRLAELFSQHEEQPIYLDECMTWEWESFLRLIHSQFIDVENSSSFQTNSGGLLRLLDAAVACKVFSCDQMLGRVLHRAEQIVSSATNDHIKAALSSNLSTGFIFGALARLYDVDSLPKWADDIAWRTLSDLSALDLAAIVQAYSKWPLLASIALFRLASADADDWVSLKLSKDQRLRLWDGRHRLHKIEVLLQQSPSDLQVFHQCDSPHNAEQQSNCKTATLEVWKALRCTLDFEGSDIVREAERQYTLLKSATAPCSPLFESVSKVICQSQLLEAFGEHVEDMKKLALAALQPDMNPRQAVVIKLLSTAPAVPLTSLTAQTSSQGGSDSVSLRSPRSLSPEIETGDTSGPIGFASGNLESTTLKIAQTSTLPLNTSTFSNAVFMPVVTAAHSHSSPNHQASSDGTKTSALVGTMLLQPTPTATTPFKFGLATRAKAGQPHRRPKTTQTN